MQIGDIVQLENDPSRRGVIAKGPRRRRLGNVEYDVWYVRWDDGTAGWQPEHQLRLAPTKPSDALELLEEGRFCGRHSELRRNVTFCQVAGNVRNLVYSMDATNIEFLPYQYKPVLTFLESPSNGILIADEVGLGKTIEAGLIWTELRARSDARRLVVICPAALCDKWVLELGNKFGVSARQVDANGLLKELDAPKYRAVESQGLVCSIQGVRPPKQYDDPSVNAPAARLARFLEEQDGRNSIIDLLVVDEAHHLRNPETTSARIGTLLRDASSHVVLLSATPVNNKEDDLFNLLRLVDPDTFPVPEVFPAVLEANEPLVRARRLVMDGQSQPKEIKELLRRASGYELLRGNRRLRGIIDSIDEESLADPSRRVELASRIDKTSLHRHVVSRTRKREVQELCVERKAYRPEVKMPVGGVEEEFYQTVTASIRRYAKGKDVGTGFLLVMPQRMMSSCMYAAARAWANKLSHNEVAQLADEADDGEGVESRESAQPLMEHIAADLIGFDYRPLRDADTKFKIFCGWLLKYMSEHPDDKVIVFSFFKATLEYLSERLAEHGVLTQVLHGGFAENKQSAIDRFRLSGDTKVLLTSEVASEGVDLQFSRCIANYDLPWNPMRIEQRIGRIDRIGQEASKVLIVNMVYGDTIDERIYTLLLEKIGIFERSIGGMEVILGELRDLEGALLRQELTEEEETKRIEQTEIAFANKRKQQDELEKQASHLVAFEDFVLRQVKEDHDLKRRITSHDLKVYARDYLDRHAEEPFEFREDPNEPLCVEIALPPKLRVDLAEYIRNERMPTGTRLTEGHLRRYVFSHKIEHPSQRRERINQFHPLIRFIGSRLKPSAEEFCPLVAFQLRSGQGENSWPAGDYAFALRRWRFGGGRPVDELRARSVRMGDRELLASDRSWNLVSAGKQHGVDWHGARIDVNRTWATEAIGRCQAKLDEDYERVHQDRKNSNDDRIDFQVKTLKRRAARQVARLHEVLRQHREHDRKGLVRATEQRIRNTEVERNTEIAQRELKRQFVSHSEEMCAGVVRVIAEGNG